MGGIGNGQRILRHIIFSQYLSCEAANDEILGCSSENLCIAGCSDEMLGHRVSSVRLYETLDWLDCAVFSAPVVGHAGHGILIFREIAVWLGDFAMFLWISPVIRRFREMLRHAPDFCPIRHLPRGIKFGHMTDMLTAPYARRVRMLAHRTAGMA